MRTDGLDHFGAGGIGIALQQHLGAHQEAGRTEAALHGPPVDEGHAERPAERFRQALKRDHLAVGHLAHGRGAGEARLAVQFHETGPAGRLRRAAVLRRREMPVVAEVGEERNGGIAVVNRHLPVEPERDHGLSPEDAGGYGGGASGNRSLYLRFPPPQRRPAGRRRIGSFVLTFTYTILPMLRKGNVSQAARTNRRPPRSPSFPAFQSTGLPPRNLPIT